MAVTVETKKEAPKGPETKVEPAKPIEPVVFKQKENQAKALVEKTYKGFGQNPEAKALHDELDKWIDDTFNKQTEPFGLRKNYENARQQLLHGTDKGEGEGLGSELGKKTMEYFTKERPDEIIKILSERREITKAKELVEHNTLQSKLKEGESARAKVGVSPNDKLEAEQKIREVETKIIENYLKGQKLPTEMAPYIVSVLNDTGDYKSDKPEDLKGSLDKALKDNNSTVSKAVKSLIDNSPKLDASQDQVDYINGLVKNGQEKYGIGDKQVERITKMLATNYRKFSQGNEDKPAYIVDLDNNSVLSPKQFENVVLANALKQYSNPDEIDASEKSFNKGAEKRKDLYERLPKKVTELSDLKNEELSGQISANQKMEKQIRPLEEAANKAKAAEPVAQTEANAIHSETFDEARRAFGLTPAKSTDRATAENENLKPEDAIKRLDAKDLNDFIVGLTMYVGEDLFDPRNSEKPENKDKFDKFMSGVKTLDNKFKNKEITSQQAIEEIVKLTQEIDPQGKHDFNSLTRKMLETSIDGFQKELKNPNNRRTDIPDHLRQLNRIYGAIQGKEGGDTGADKPNEKARDNLVKQLEGLVKNPATASILQSTYPEIAKRMKENKVDFNDEAGKQLADRIISEMPKEVVAALEKGEAVTVVDMAKGIIKIPEIARISDRDPTEIDLVEKTLGKDNLNNKFGEATPMILENLSRVHEIKAGEGGKGMLIDGKPVTDINELGDYLKPEIKAKIDQLTDPNIKKGDLAKIQKELGEGLGSDNKLLAEFNKAKVGFGKALEGLEGAKGSEKLGTVEAFGVLIQMYGMLKAGDWESLNEAMADFTAKPPKSPMKVMKECSDAYQKKLNEVAASTPASDLLEAYLKPRGPEADKIFPAPGKGVPPLGRYRGAICEPIAKMIGSQMGIDPIEKISRDGAHIIIDGSVNGDKVSTHIYKKDGNLMRAAGSFETKTTTDSKGKETTNTTHGTPGEGVVIGKENVTLGQVNKDIVAKAKVESERVALEKTKNDYKGIIDKLEPKDKTTLLNKIGEQKFEGKLDDKYPKLDSKIKKPADKKQQETQQDALNKERALYVMANFNKYKSVLDGQGEFKDLQPKKEEPAVAVASAEKTPTEAKKEPDATPKAEPTSAKTPEAHQPISAEQMLKTLKNDSSLKKMLDTQQLQSTEKYMDTLAKGLAEKGYDANPIIGMELKTVNGKNIFTITLDNNTRIEGAPNIAPMASFENALSKLPKKVA